MIGARFSQRCRPCPSGAARGDAAYQGNLAGRVDRFLAGQKPV